MSQSVDKRKESIAKAIERTWKLVSLDDFLDHPVSFVDPSIKSNYANIVLKPHIYSHHFLSKLWTICRCTSPALPPLDVRRLLAAALIKRVEKDKNPRNRTTSVVVSDLNKVTQQLGLSTVEAPDDQNARDDREPLLVPPKASESSEDPILEEKVEDTIVAKGAPTMAQTTTTRSDPISQPNVTLKNQTPVTSARFEVCVPESMNGTRPATPTPHPPAPAPRPSASAPRPSQQSPRTAVPAAAPVATATSAQQPLPSMAPTVVTNCAVTKPQEPASANKPAPAKSNSNPKPVPARPAAKSPVTLESPENSHHTETTPAARPEANAAPRERHSDAPRAAETPNLRRPAPATTPNSERPWKRAKTAKFNEVKSCELRIRDVEYEMEVSNAQVNMYARRLKAHREMEEGEIAYLKGIQDYLSKEPAINNRISDYVKVLTKLVGLHGEFRTALSLAPDPEGLEPPTIPEGTTVESPPVALSNLIKSLTKYHDGFAQDLDEAKSELQLVKDGTAEIKETTKRIEQDLLSANLERDMQRLRLLRLKERLKVAQEKQ